MVNPMIYTLGDKAGNYLNIVMQLASICVYTPKERWRSQRSHRKILSPLRRSSDNTCLFDFVETIQLSGCLSLTELFDKLDFWITTQVAIKHYYLANTSALQYKGTFYWLGDLKGVKRTFK